MHHCCGIARARVRGHSSEFGRRFNPITRGRRGTRIASSDFGRSGAWSRARRGTRWRARKSPAHGRACRGAVAVTIRMQRERSPTTQPREDGSSGVAVRHPCRTPAPTVHRDVQDRMPTQAAVPIVPSGRQGCLRTRCGGGSCGERKSCGLQCKAKFNRLRPCPATSGVRRPRADAMRIQR